VVSQAGSGIVLGALAHGLPQVCLPIGADQPLNAARCAALGAGVHLDALAGTPADVREATARVLADPGFAAAAGRLRAELDALPPVSHALALVEALVSPAASAR
jgi:UDP:flavonoid glycosyltransferase YjiC (YdhE family)